MHKNYRSQLKQSPWEHFHPLLECRTKEGQGGAWTFAVDLSHEYSRQTPSRTARLWHIYPGTWDLPWVVPMKELQPLFWGFQTCMPWGVIQKKTGPVGSSPRKSLLRRDGHHDLPRPGWKHRPGWADEVRVKLCGGRGEKSLSAASDWCNFFENVMLQEGGKLWGELNF